MFTIRCLAGLDLMTPKLRNIIDAFFATTKKGYDDYYWIFVIIAGAGIVTKLFGIAGAGAAIVGFLAFYSWAG